MSTENRYQPALSIHVLWMAEPEKDSDGQPATRPLTTLAESLFATFSRSIDAPLERGPGIPVLFHNGEPPAPVILDYSDHTILVVLVDDRMVINTDWQLGLEKLTTAVTATGQRHRLYPVALSPFSFNLTPKVGVTNFIRLQGLPERKHAPRLSTLLTHELCRLLQAAESGESAPQASGRLAPAPLMLFLSHAKADGEGLAQTLRDHIESTGAVQSFFDANDIDPGFDFRTYLEDNIARSVLVVLQTDHYASRTWCRREVLWAKSKGCPLVLVNAVQDLEERGFPYLGNAPALRVDGSEPDWPERVVALALGEALRRLWFKAHLKGLMQIGLVPTSLHPSLGPPEVLNLLTGVSPTELPDGTQGLIYPDPPLGTEERALLSLAAPNLLITTPTSCAGSMPQAGATPPLQGMWVAISISNSPDLARFGMGKPHLQDAMTELARYLLSQGAHLVYGGDLRPGGFTEQLLELVAAYNDELDENNVLPSPHQDEDFASRRLTNYVAWPISLNYTEAQLAQHFLKGVFEFIDPPPDLGLDQQQLENFVPPNTPEHRYWWFRSLTAMRQAMADTIDARVLLGGQVRGFAGGVPGLVEETLLALQHRQPVFLLGGMGGCTRVIIDAIEGRRPKELTTEYQSEGKAYKYYAEFLEHIKTRSEAVPIDYEAMLDELQQAGIAGLNNGLSDTENRELFETPHIPVMVSLVLKGLTACKGKGV